MITTALFWKPGRKRKPNFRTKHSTTKLEKQAYGSIQASHSISIFEPKNSKDLEGEKRAAAYKT